MSWCFLITLPHSHLCMRIIFCLLLNSFAVNYCVYTLSINKNKYTTTTELKTESENISKLNLHNIGRYGLAHNINDTQRFPVKWRKIDEEWSLHPLNVTALEIREDDEKRYFHIRVVVTKHRVAVFRDDAMLYERRGNLSEYGFYTHSGIHVLVLHPQEGYVMLTRMFITHQPGEDRNLAKCLADLMPGRLLIVAAVPDAAAFLGPGAIRELERMGSNRIRKLATFEAWILVAHTPAHDFVPLEHYYPAYESPPSIHEKKTKGRVWAEVITIRRRYEIVYASPTHITALVPKLPDFRCSWHDDPAMAEQKIFCEKYEGYTRLCTCEDPITSAYRFHSTDINIKEVIPVAMLTAVKPFNFYRQLLNLFEVPGAAQTPILVLTDGAQHEITQLARLFGLDILVHNPQGAKGSSTLLNMHFRFSVHNVFNFFPNIDKAVILEDDLLLSPDFLIFFQQTAWLLDADPTIYCVNAFSVNSFPDVAYDPTILRRLEMFPQFGWMVTREWAREQYELWIPEKAVGDWDWWLYNKNARQERHALIPEISRTFHAGSAGAHVTGWAQEHIFSHMIYNKDPAVRLRDLENLTSRRYEEKFRKDLLRASVLSPTASPCREPLIPRNQTGPFKVFVRVNTKGDEYDSFFVMRLCLHAYPEDSREQYKGVMRFNIHGHVLYIVGCPLSPYCSLFPEGVTILKPSQQLVTEAEIYASAWQTRNYPLYYQQRGVPSKPEQEFCMENLYNIYHNGSTVRQY